MEMQISVSQLPVKNDLRFFPPLAKSRQAGQMQLSKTQIKDNMDLLFLLSKRQIKHGPNVEK